MHVPWSTSCHLPHKGVFFKGSESISTFDLRDTEKQGHWSKFIKTSSLSWEQFIWKLLCNFYLTSSLKSIDGQQDAMVCIHPSIYSFKQLSGTAEVVSLHGSNEPGWVSSVWVVSKNSHITCTRCTYVCQLEHQALSICQTTIYII